MPDFMEAVRQRAGGRNRRLVLVGGGVRMLAAAEILSRRGLAAPVLLGDPAALRQEVQQAGIRLPEVTILTPGAQPERRRRDLFLRWGGAQGVREAEVLDWLSHPLVYAVAVVAGGEADGVIAVEGPASQEGLRRLGRLGGKDGPGSRMLRYAAATAPWGVSLFAEPGMPHPSAPQLAETALAAADWARRVLGVEPRAAFVSPVTHVPLGRRGRFASAAEELENRVRDAVATARARREGLSIEPEVRDGVPDWGVAAAESAPNTWVFVEPQGPTLTRWPEEESVRWTGPFRRGFPWPMSEVSSRAAAEDVVDAAVLAALEE